MLHTAVAHCCETWCPVAGCSNSHIKILRRTVSHRLHTLYALLSVLLPLANSKCTDVLKLCSSAHDCVRVQAEAGVRVGSDDDHD